jgi:hypothetical protein
LLFVWGQKAKRKEKGMREKAHLSGAIHLHKNLFSHSALKLLGIFEEEKK